MSRAAKDGILLAFYGDDFTGSTDAMEVTALAGLKTVLFTRTPDAKTLAAFAEYDVIGIAGTARFRSPDWMEENLPPVFEALSRLNPRIVQYKICSTFDSSPQVGSIGRAIDIGTRIVGGTWSPSIVGAPQLGRYQVFGNLFAAADGARYRIDRHPTMSRHPVTPMLEADLRVHLASQTTKAVQGLDFLSTHGPPPTADAEDCPVVFLDVLDANSQERAGRMVWENAKPMTFSASSSGLQYALVAHWRANGRIPIEPPEPARISQTDRLLVLSGSCSPMTARQIAFAEANGLASIRLDVVAASNEETAGQELMRMLAELEKALDTAEGAVLYAAKTVDDSAFQRLKDNCGKRGQDFVAAQESLGRFLGEVAYRAISRFSLTRMIVAGGDTSGNVVGALPIDALEVASPLAPGVPLCRCFSSEELFDGLQLALKGGQMGGGDFFVRALGRVN